MLIMRMTKTFVAAVAWWNVIASEPLGEGAVMMMIGMFDVGSGRYIPFHNR